MKWQAFSTVRPPIIDTGDEKMIWQKFTWLGWSRSDGSWSGSSTSGRIIIRWIHLIWITWFGGVFQFGKQISQKCAFSYLNCCVVRNCLLHVHECYEGSSMATRRKPNSFFLQYITSNFSRNWPICSTQTMQHLLVESFEYWVLNAVSQIFLLWKYIPAVAFAMDLCYFS